MIKEKLAKAFSKFLSVMIVFAAVICLILLYKTITKSDVSLLGIRFYYVATESMYPTIKPSSLIVVKDTDTDKLEVGDIISFISSDPAISGMVNTHRIYAIQTGDDGSRIFITMGDNNPEPDSYPVYPEDIVGKVIFYTVPLKVLTSILSYAGTKSGFVVVIIMPLIIVAGFFFNSLLKSIRKGAEEAAEQELEEQAAGDRGGADAAPEAVPVITAGEVQASPADGRQSVELTPEVARQILAAAFGKPVEQITQEDIEAMFRSVSGENK